MASYFNKLLVMLALWHGKRAILFSPRFNTFLSKNQAEAKELTRKILKPDEENG